jgi:hypothetical protein
MRVRFRNRSALPQADLPQYGPPANALLPQAIIARVANALASQSFRTCWLSR